MAVSAPSPRLAVVSLRRPLALRCHHGIAAFGNLERIIVWMPARVSTAVTGSFFARRFRLLAQAAVRAGGRGRSGHWRAAGAGSTRSSDTRRRAFRAGKSLPASRGGGWHPHRDNRPDGAGPPRAAGAVAFGVVQCMMPSLRGYFDRQFPPVHRPWLCLGLSASARDTAGCRSEQKRGAHGCQEEDEIRTEG